MEFSNNEEQKGRFSSRDAKFTFNVGEKGLPSSTFAVVAQTMGPPGVVDGEIIAGPYLVSFPDGVSPTGKELQLRYV